MDEYEAKNGVDMLEIRIFSDGSGTAHDFEGELFEFNCLEELFKELNQ